MRSLARDFFLVAACAAEGRIEAVFVERLLERFGLHHLVCSTEPESNGLIPRARPSSFNAPELEAEALGGGVAERDHLAEFPRRIDVQQRKRRLGGIEGLHRQVRITDESLPME